MMTRLLLGLSGRLARAENALLLVAEPRDKVGDGIGDLLVLGPQPRDKVGVTLWTY